MKRTWMRGALALGVVAACADTARSREPSRNGDSDASDADVRDASLDYNIPEPITDAAIDPCSEDGWCRISPPTSITDPSHKMSFGTVSVENGLGVFASSGVEIFQYRDGAWQISGVLRDSKGGILSMLGMVGDGLGHLMAYGGTDAWHSIPVVFRGPDGWTPEAIPPALGGGRIMRLVRISKGVLWGATEEGKLFRWATETGTWDIHPITFTDVTLEAIWGTSDTDLFVKGFREPGQRDFVLHRRVGDGGSPEWNVIYDIPRWEPAKPYVQAGWAAAGGDSWVSISPYRSQQQGGIAKLNPYVDALNAMQEDTFVLPIAAPGATSFWGSSKDDLWAVGVSGGIFHYDGAAWSRSTTVVNGAPLASNLWSISGDGVDEIWIVGQNGIVLQRKKSQ